LQKHLFEAAYRFLQEHTHEVNSYDEFKTYMKSTRGFLRAYWCEQSECEAKIKDETKATTRVRALDEQKENGKCIVCGKPASYRWYFAQAY